MLTEQGAPGNELYLVLDGVLAVEVDGTVVAEVGPGAVLGERAILEGGPRTSTLRTVTPCRIAVAVAEQIERDALHELSEGHRREELADVNWREGVPAAGPRRSEGTTRSGRRRLRAHRRPHRERPAVRRAGLHSRSRRRVRRGRREHVVCRHPCRDGRWLVLDAGTGLRRLGAVLDGSPLRGTILLTHLHWDHTQGLPFLPNADRPDAEVALWLPAQATDETDPVAVLRRSMSPPHFPIGPDGLLGSWSFGALPEGRHTIEGFTVTAAEIEHKGGRTYGYRVERSDGCLAYLSDHCPRLAGPKRRAAAVEAGRRRRRPAPRRPVPRRRAGDRRRLRARHDR